MTRIEELIEETIESGFVLSLSTMLLEDWDWIIRNLNKKLGKAQMEGVCYCSPQLLEISTQMLDNQENTVSGTFPNQERTAYNLMCDISFSRGNFTIHLISKPVTKSIFIPVVNRDAIDPVNCVVIDLE